MVDFIDYGQLLISSGEYLVNLRNRFNWRCFMCMQTLGDYGRLSTFFILIMELWECENVHISWNTNPSVSLEWLHGYLLCRNKKVPLCLYLQNLTLFLHVISTFSLKRLVFLPYMKYDIQNCWAVSAATVPTSLQFCLTVLEVLSTELDRLNFSYSMHFSFFLVSSYLIFQFN